VRRQVAGRWAVVRYELAGEAGRRLEPLELAGPRAEDLPRPGRVYLEAPSGTCRPAHPLLLYDQDTGEFFFLLSRQGDRRFKHLSYSSGRVIDQEESEADAGELLPSILGVEGGPEAVPAPAEKVHEEPRAKPSPGEGKRRIGEFELLSRIGRGGMGVVYRAWQPSLGRQVALKCLVGTGDPRLETRFAREIRSLGRVEHPNLVKIHTSGSDGDQWFYAMELIEGADLASVTERLAGSTASEVGEPEWRRALSTACIEARKREEPIGASPERLDAGLPLEAPAAPGPGAPRLRTDRGHIVQVVEIVRQVAEAAHALHEAGVVHRDIKPGNIMLTPGGSHAVLMDLGLAQLADEADGRLTRTRQFVGTLRYASPEQVLAAGTLDRRSDIYSLGATLWELLSLRPLFGSDDTTPTPELMLKIQSAEPGRVRRLNPLVPPDLEAIVQKCLEKDRARRYGTARELAEDLERWQRGEPVAAEPPTLRYLLGKLARRYRVRLSIAAALILATVIGTGMAVYRIERERRMAELALFDLYTSHGVRAGEEGKPAEAMLWFASALPFAGNDPEREELNRIRLRTWSREAPLPVRAFRHQGGKLREIAFHPGEGYLIALTEENRCVIWDLEKEKPLPLPGADRAVSQAAFTPDGKRLVLLNPEGSVEVLSFPGGERLYTIESPAPVRAMALSPDGGFLALAGEKIRLWDLRERRFLAPDLELGKAPVHLVFDSRGGRLVASANDGTASLFVFGGKAWERSPRFVFEPEGQGSSTPGDPGPPRPVFIDGDRGLIAGIGRIATWWDLESGSRVREIPHAPMILAGADGRYFAAGSQVEMNLWEASRGRPAGPRIPKVWSTAAALSPDGMTLANADWDSVVGLWNPGLPVLHWNPKRIELLAPIYHQREVSRMTFSASGRFLATVQGDGLVRVFSFAERPLERRHIFTGGMVCQAIPSLDGRYVAALGTRYYRQKYLARTRVFEVESGLPAGPTLEAGGLITGGAFDPHGDRLVLLTDLGTGEVRFWSWREGKAIFPPRVVPSEPMDAAYSPDGRLLVVVCAGGQVLLVDPESGALQKTLDHGGKVSIGRRPVVRFSPRGESFITWGMGNTAQVWETASAKHLYPPLRHEDIVAAATLSEDGRLLATGSLDGSLVVRDAATGKPLAKHLQHPSGVIRAMFSPDASLVLVTCYRDRMARIWDWRRRELACPPLEHGSLIEDASFSPDGRWVLTLGLDRARLWEGESGKPVAPPRKLFHGALQAFFTPDGSRALGAVQGPLLAVIPLGDLREPLPGGREALKVWGEVLCGRTIGNVGGTASLTSEEWLRRWEVLRAIAPDLAPFDASREARIRWHRLQAGLLEEKLQWETAGWHLSRIRDLGEGTEERLARLQEFVRAWRFSPRTQPWNLGSFAPMDPSKLAAIEASAASGRLARSEGPFVDFHANFPEKDSGVAAYALRAILCDGPCKVRILAGSDDAIRI
ncbi:MAG: protein kinase, partial [Planctomycetes bacterium]|nr:protein kinase [Planctomycetota bacterium]